MFIGKLNSFSYPYWFNGDMDEVRIYNRAINADEVNAIGGCSPLVSCTNWLNTQAVGQSVKVGDLDVSGTNITVEAQFNRTSPYFPSFLYAGDIVSKHDSPADANYVLRPNDAEITTTDGYFIAASPCEIDLHKTYHAALVYNGSTLKFYRNGFLMSSVPASGNLYLNDWITTIGDYAYPFPDVGTNFLGYINEVRIWNVARTQTQIRTYMNSSLPNPATQTGLLAYYTFDNLLNKQGNTAWNGSIAGAATINATNPDCVFHADSCNGILPVTLTDFKATVVDNKKIVLSWNTENELNIRDYSVQRSATGYDPDYITLGKVSSQKNAHSNKYVFTDNTARPNTLYYYRLIINDMDDSKNFSPVRTAKILNKDFYTIVYPNPTDGIIKISINNAASEVNIKVIDGPGKLITQKRSSASNTEPVLLDISHAATGIYFVIIESNSYRFVERILKR